MKALSTTTSTTTTTKIPGPICFSKYDHNKDMIGVCQNVDSCTGAAISGNCSLPNHVCCVPEPVEPIEEKSNNIITKARFLKIVGDTIRNRAIYRYFTESLDLAGITTEYQIAAYLSQLISETDYFKKIESTIIENDNNSIIGNNQVNDGTAFRGRGGILLRGRTAYDLAQRANSKYLID